MTCLTGRRRTVHLTDNHQQQSVLARLTPSGSNKRRSSRCLIAAKSLRARPAGPGARQAVIHSRTWAKAPRTSQSLGTSSPPRHCGSARRGRRSGCSRSRTRCAAGPVDGPHHPLHSVRQRFCVGRAAATGSAMACRSVRPSANRSVRTRMTLPIAPAAPPTGRQAGLPYVLNLRRSSSRPTPERSSR